MHIKTLVMITSIILLNSVHASTLQISPTGSSSNGTGYFYRGDWFIDDSNTSGRVACNHPYTCTVAISGVTYSGAFPFVTSTHGGIGLANIPIGTPWADIMTRWVATYGRSGIYTTSAGYYGASSICVASYNVVDSRIGAFMPGSSCKSVGPIGTSCTVTSGNASISHGTLAPGSIQGHTATTDVTVNCNNAATVRLTRAPTVDLGYNVNSNLSFDGYTSGASFTLPRGVSNHTITSTLTSTGALPGNLRGSATMIIDFI